jgi:hypothetical protein
MKRVDRYESSGSIRRMNLCVGQLGSRSRVPTVRMALALLVLGIP